MLKILFKIQVLVIVFLLGKFSYGLSLDSDGFGVFVAGLGGYHVSLDDSESGVYQ